MACMDPAHTYPTHTLPYPTMSVTKDMLIVWHSEIGGRPVCGELYASGRFCHDRVPDAAAGLQRRAPALQVW